MTEYSDEKALETVLCDRIAGKKRAELEQILIHKSNTEFHDLAALIGDREFTVLQDRSEWNQHKNLLVDISGGMTPDIVIRSNATNQNRIIIEVKSSAPLGCGRVDSQVIRYFLHLLGTTLQDASKTDIRRALILAAPDCWFDVARNRDDWQYFLDTYKDIARAFDITLGEIRLPLLHST